MDPTFGLSGTNLKVESVRMAESPSGEIVFTSCDGLEGYSETKVFPIWSWLSFVSTAFQLIPGIDSAVFTPNFTDCPGLIDSEVVKTRTPCRVFFPVHPFSVLKDLKALSSPSHILIV